MDTHRHHSHDRRHHDRYHHDDKKDDDRKNSRDKKDERRGTPEKKRARLEVKDDEFPIEKRTNRKPMDPETREKTRRMMGLFAAHLNKIKQQEQKQKELDEKRQEIMVAAEAEAKQRAEELSIEDQKKFDEEEQKDADNVPLHDDNVVQYWKKTDALSARFKKTGGPRPIYWAPKDLIRKLATNQQPAEQHEEEKSDSHRHHHHHHHHRHSGGNRDSVSVDMGDGGEGCGRALTALIEDDKKEGRVNELFLSETRSRRFLQDMEESAGDKDASSDEDDHFDEEDKEEEDGSDDEERSEGEVDDDKKDDEMTANNA